MEQEKKISKDPMTNHLFKIVGIFIKALALLMIVVIFWALIDVIIHVYTQSVTNSLHRFEMDNLITILGSFLGVLIAIEIFLNIIFILKSEKIHVPLVLATALTAIARKIIILNYAEVNPLHIFAMASVLFAAGSTYWLVTKNSSHDISPIF